nr:zinc ribbon domain-containing protein [Anaerolineae bacterium]
MLNIFSDLKQLSGAAVIIVTILAAIGTAIWISLAIWANRDMRVRSRDVIARTLATVVVALLGIPGLIVYLILRPRETLSEQYERALEEEALLQEIEDKPVCPGCGHTSKPAWRICPYCHTRLKKECNACGELLELAWNVCPYCEHVQRTQVQQSHQLERGEGEYPQITRQPLSSRTVFEEDA